ncbi:uncharacterized protein LOC124660328 [Lolium rigidum]|uniref:uncharacterized protein LOC124660328 n=1 Tax=Lolium rigidum TaxID=89674 RepID=UPI001F5CDC77|nr:uncharacterized protein LOC124660328 [Lolium rigidum]
MLRCRSCHCLRGLCHRFLHPCPCIRLRRCVAGLASMSCLLGRRAIAHRIPAGVPQASMPPLVLLASQLLIRLLLLPLVPPITCRLGFSSWLLLILWLFLGLVRVYTGDLVVRVGDHFPLQFIHLYAGSFICKTADSSCSWPGWTCRSSFHCLLNFVRCCFFQFQNF